MGTQSRAWKRNRWCSVGCTIVTLVIIGLLIAIIVLAVKLNNAKGNRTPAPTPSRSVGLLEHYQLSDGIDLRWFPHANSQESLSEALAGDYNIIETNVRGTSKLSIISLEDTEKPISETMTISFEDWLKQVTKSGAGMKLNLNADTDLLAVLEKVKTYDVHAPVILSMPYPVYKEGELKSNLSRFISAFSQRHWTFPLIASVDLTPLCCEAPVGVGTTEFLWRKFRHVDVPLNIEINAKQWRSSWISLMNLLDRSQAITITASIDEQSDNYTPYDLLYVRNDNDKERVFYKVNGTTLRSFRELVSTAGSPLHYFDIQPRDAGKIIWSHNTDTWELLHNAVNGPTMMVEADLRLKNNIPIMAHDKGDDNNLTFVQWLDEIIKVNKGMKLDFKELEAMGPVLEIVSRRKKDIKGPVWVNADIVEGPYGKNVTMIPSIFFENVNAFPDVTLSIGWTTGRKDSRNLNYTMEMAKEMYELSKTLQQPVTFPVYSALIRSSWEVFDWLLQQSRAYTLTIWTTPFDNTTKEDMDFIKRQTEAARVYFDLPEDLRPSLD